MKGVARSYLFVPGNRPDRFAKALASGAHAVVIDLEDAVGAGEKGVARKAVSEWLDPTHPVVVRVNGASSEWFRDDLALCGRPGIVAVMVPKVEDADHVRLVAEGTRGRLPLLPLVESARGFDRAADIARAPGVQRLVFGSLDFQLDLGLAGDGEETVYFRSHLTLVSRLAGLQPPVDGVWPGIGDGDQMLAHALRARRLGFGGKLCIHPSQVAAVNSAFLPSEEEIAWARRVLQVAAQGAVGTVDGRMVDRPVILRAEEILDEAGGQAP